MRRLVVAAGLALALAAGAVVPALDAGAAPKPITTAPVGPATKAAVVEATIASDVVAVYDRRQLSDGTGLAAVAAARQAGGEALVTGGGALGLTRVLRGTAIVQAAPPNERYAMSATAVPPTLAGRIMSRDVARVLGAGQIVMGAGTAALRGALAGDTAEVLGWNGTTYRLTIGMVAPDDLIGGTEILLADDTATAIGMDRPSEVVLWGFRSRAAIEQAMAANGLGGPNMRIRRSWDPPDPDGQLSTSEVKQALGDFPFSGSGEGMVIDPAWTAANLVRVDFSATGIPIRSLCHTKVVAALRGALTEVAASGLSGAIDVGNTNTFGGCFHAHEITPLGGTTGGIVSRHSWGMAIDMNTVQNAEGTPPTMDCRVVRIFRKWGFAWGGNFLSSDGMHFEWVGERRDQLAYPSRYCPNVVIPGAADAVVATGAPAPAASGLGRIFVDPGE